MAGTTEDRLKRFRGLDDWESGDILHALLDGQMQALAACVHAVPELAAAVDLAARRLQDGNGRLIYVGAGSSGMVAALDALDLGDTFDWPDERLAIVVPNGLDLSRGIVAELEDDAGEGMRRIAALVPTPDDVVLGVSASGASAFTVAAVEEGRRCGALTIGLVSVARSDLAEGAERAIVVATGAEVVAGSTRMGAGTAQKAILNMFSTTLMTRLGAVYDNLMVNVRPRNEKLRRRCIAIVAEIAGIDRSRAATLLAQHGDTKGAVLAALGASPEVAQDLLHSSNGNLRAALAALRCFVPN